MKIISVVGARPNFMKVAPIIHTLRAKDGEHILVHTGQHYDYAMSQLFFEELGIPKPDVDLGVGSGSHAAQTAEVMKRFEPVVIKESPDLVIVAGDVNSTMACAITAVKLGVPVAHVEAGLRSFDRTMPEEINRIVTDSIASYHFTTEESANRNLCKEGIPEERISFVGNTMIDTLMKHMDRAEQSSVLGDLDLIPGRYGVITLHRPSNVDNRENFRNIFEAFHEIAGELPLIFPVHPRTRNCIKDFGFGHFVKEDSHKKENGIFITDPLGYLAFLKLMKNARIVFTDSGGIQEETTSMGVPCLTLRYNTERPVTVTSGTNVLVGAESERIIAEALKRLNGYCPAHSMPPLWDGHAAERIVDVIRSRFS